MKGVSDSGFYRCCWGAAIRGTHGAISIREAISTAQQYNTQSNEKNTLWHRCFDGK